MSVFFIGDMHLGHKAIAKYRPCVKDVNDNTLAITSEWKQRVHKRDTVYVMGDAAFDDQSLLSIRSLPGTKILIKGNHDDMTSTLSQMDVFKEIHGMLRYKGIWLTHAPIHPNELRGRRNLHGHVHYHSIMRRNFLGIKTLDRRYFNSSCDAVYKRTGKFMTTLDDVRLYFS